MLKLDILINFGKCEHYLGGVRIWTDFGYFWCAESKNMRVAFHISRLTHLRCLQNLKNLFRPKNGINSCTFDNSASINLIRILTSHYKGPVFIDGLSNSVENQLLFWKTFIMYVNCFCKIVMWLIVRSRHH